MFSYCCYQWMCLFTLDRFSFSLFMWNVSIMALRFFSHFYMEPLTGILGNKVKNNQMENPQATPVSISEDAELEDDEILPLSGKPHFTVIFSTSHVKGQLVISLSSSWTFVNLMLGSPSCLIWCTWITCHILREFFLYDSILQKPNC